MRVIVSMVLFLTVFTACGTTPEECVALCDRIEQWAIQCKKPVLTKGTCKRYYETERPVSTAIRCWEKLLTWSPDLSAEFDCTKPPPALNEL